MSAKRLGGAASPFQSFARALAHHLSGRWEYVRPGLRPAWPLDRAARLRDPEGRELCLVRVGERIAAYVAESVAGDAFPPPGPHVISVGAGRTVGELARRIERSLLSSLPPRPARPALGRRDERAQERRLKELEEVLRSFSQPPGSRGPRGSGEW